MKKAYLKFGIGIAALLFVTDVIAKRLNKEKDLNVATLVITETGKYVSLDPLDGDSSQNLPVARMVYSTPVEITADNTLGSRLLKSFEYDQSAKTIRWVVKDNLRYSDGSTISADDIAFSVSRMAFTRPKFPLIKLIQGLDSWVTQQTPLKSYPRGISVDGNKIEIKLKEDYPHPMFRFCLEIFSVIPRKCVNPATNKIECEKTPTSGLYQIASENADSVIFEKSKESNILDGEKAPAQIKFIYADTKTAFEDPVNKSNATIVLSSESKFSPTELSSIQGKFEISYTPAAWFTVLQINPEVPPFNSPGCRLLFADRFRQNFEELYKVPAEASIFTKLVPGYKTIEELKNSVDSNQKNCLEQLNGAKVPWGFESSTPNIFVETILKTAKDLGLTIDGPKKFRSKKEEVEAFLSNQTTFAYARTGFWAMDPTGDIQMLFTPNLHKGLKHFWNDLKLQSQLQKIVSDGKVNDQIIDSVNNYLFADSKLSVYSHIRRFYASKNKDLVLKRPQGITSPSPWHLFGDME